MEGTKVSSEIWGHRNHTFHVRQQLDHRAACVATGRAELAYLISRKEILGVFRFLQTRSAQQMKEHFLKIVDETQIDSIFIN